jgi:iron-sulfur cluster insertion protein
MESLFILTEAAKTKIIEILQEENVFQGRFRIYLSLSNSTGYQYAFAIDDEMNDDDLIFEYEYQENHFSILIDSMTIQYLKDSTVDCKQKENETMLVITNPNAADE